MERYLRSDRPLQGKCPSTWAVRFPASLSLDMTAPLGICIVFHARPGTSAFNVMDSDVPFFRSTIQGSKDIALILRTILGFAKTYARVSLGLDLWTAHDENGGAPLEAGCPVSARLEHGPRATCQGIHHDPSDTLHSEHNEDSADF